MKRKLIFLITAISIVAAGCGESDADAPTTTVAAAAPITTAAPAAEMGDIVETAQGAGGFATLLTAATAAGLVDTLKGEGPFTVFAPTDEAFAALPKGTLTGLLGDTQALTNVLLYHVVGGTVTSDQVAGLKSATTLQGQDIAIRIEGGKVYINDAKVLTTDILADNGVIHVIDKVILPS